MIEKEGIDVFQYRDNSGDYHYVTKNKFALDHIIYLCNTSKNGDGEDYIRLYNQIAQRDSLNGGYEYLKDPKQAEDLCKAESPVFYVVKGYDAIKNWLLKNPDENAALALNEGMAECLKINRVYYIY